MTDKNYHYFEKYLKKVGESIKFSKKIIDTISE